MSNLCVVKVLKNQIIYTPILSPILYYYNNAELSINHIVWQLPTAVIVTDIIFYPLHRIMHHPKLYKYHAAHHIWDPPMACSALYSDPFEHCYINILPPLLASIITQMNFIVMCIWFFLATLNTVLAHSYEGTHTIHHKYRAYNYGVGLMTMDRIFKTYKKD